MKVRIFDAMTSEEAAEYLADFLAFGRNKGVHILEEKLQFTTDLNFKIESLSAILKALVPILKTVPRSPDPGVPEFIRNTEDYHKGLFDFDDESNMVLLAAAYYLGETFVKAFPHLKWSTGNVDYLQANSPVVTGFRYNKELPVILVAENIFSSIVSGTREEESVDSVVEAWSTKFV